MPAKKASPPSGAAWLKALAGQDLEVKSARNALSSQGYLDTGNYALNWAIAGYFDGGYPLGHSTEIFGDPGTGKSFLISRAIAEVQSRQGVALLDDSEGAYNLEWIHTLGVNSEALGYISSHTVKDHLKAARAFIDAYKKLGLSGLGVLACDSLALLSTAHELEVGLDKRDMTKAQELKTFFRIVAKQLYDLPVVYLCTSHAIANIGGWGSSRTTSGGSGPKYQASIRLDLRAAAKIKQGADITGVVARAVVAKNRVVAPWKEVKLAIPFYRPISRASGLIPLLIKLGFLGTSGQFLTLEGKKLPIKTYKSKMLEQDRSAEKLLEDHPDLLERCNDVLAERMAEGNPWKGAKLGDLD